jgi:hypothetical protein
MVDAVSYFITTKAMMVGFSVIEISWALLYLELETKKIHSPATSIGEILSYKYNPAKSVNVSVLLCFNLKSSADEILYIKHYFGK